MITALERLDGAAAAWLALRDPALGHLPDALAATPPNWILHDVQWTPGQGCRLAYRVESHADLGATFVAVSLDPSGWTQYDFRSDPLLPGLVTALHSTDVLELLGTVTHEPVLNCRVLPIRYRPSARCVLRYDVRTVSGSAHYFAKLFPRSLFADAAGRATGVAAAAEPALSVTRVLAVWTTLQATVVAAVDGRSASSVLRDPGLSVARRVDLANRVGGLLADFHAVNGVSVPARTVSDQVGAVVSLLACVEIMNEPLGARLRRLVDDLARHPPPPQATTVLTHGGFRLGQIVVDDAGHLTLLDLDGVCRGDAAQDLGSALSHLAWQAIRHGTSPSHLHQLHRALLAGYQSCGAGVDPVSLSWWRVAVLAQIAARRFRRLDVAEWVLVPQLLDLAEALLGSPSGSGVL